MLFCIAWRPWAVFCDPLVLLWSAFWPVAVLSLPLFKNSAPWPVAVLLLPVVFVSSAPWPVAVLLLPVVLSNSAASPRAVSLPPVVLLRNEVVSGGRVAAPVQCCFCSASEAAIGIAVTQSVLCCSPERPTAVFPNPVVLLDSVPAPIAVLLLRSVGAA